MTVHWGGSPHVNDPKVNEIVNDPMYRNMINVLTDDLDITRYRAGWLLQKAMQEDGYVFARGTIGG